MFAQSSVEHHTSGQSSNWNLASTLLSLTPLSGIVSPKGNYSLCAHPLNAGPALGPAAAKHPLSPAVEEGLQQQQLVFIFHTGILVWKRGWGGGRHR